LMKKWDTKMRFKWRIPLLTAALLVTGTSIAEATNDLAIPAGADPADGAKTSDELAIQGRGRGGPESDGTDLPGVTVVETRTHNGTVTNLTGEYTLEVTGTSSVLIFSYVGFVTQEITVGSKTEIHISMVDSIDTIDEVVVTALGIEREQRSLGYDVANVRGE